MRFWLVLAFVFAAGAASAQPAPRFHAVFQDHAVLQRDQPISVWGESAPNAPVILTLDGINTTAQADAEGRWRATLPAHAAGGPFTLSLRAGRSTHTLSDILIGDVFLCSGQSNMQMQMREIAAGGAEIAASANPNVRLLHIPRYAGAARLTTFHDPVAWALAGPGTVDGFSAACFFMGRDLQRALNIPIGLIHASWGGTIIQPWISAEGFRGLGYDEQVAINEEYVASPATAEARWRQTAVQWWATREPGNVAGWQAPDFDDSGWQTMAQPGPWENSDDPALRGFDGIVWFRTSVALTEAQARQPARLSLGVVNDYDHVFINGHYVGGRRARGAERLHDVPTGALHAGRNVVAVGIINTGGPGGMISPPDQRALRFEDGSEARIAGPWRYRISAAIADIGRGPLPPWGGGLASNFNGMIAPLAPLALKGVAWYQGESNVGAAEEYQRLLPALFADWRRAFNNDALPFLVVQLPNYGSNASAPQRSGYAELREAQRQAVAADPHAALVVAIDIGDRFDIHPTNKQEIGRRLALAARAAIYGEDVVASGPIPLSFRRTGGRIEIAFEHAEDGLRLNGAESAIGFQLCDTERQCRFVLGDVTGDIVRLPAPNRRASAIVRYCWADSPLCNLANAHDLPAVPFEQAVN